jgi:hypothetical protein
MNHTPPRNRIRGASQGQYEALRSFIPAHRRPSRRPPAPPVKSLDGRSRSMLDRLLGFAHRVLRRFRKPATTPFVRIHK